MKKIFVYIFYFIFFLNNCFCYNYRVNNIYLKIKNSNIKNNIYYLNLLKKKFNNNIFNFRINEIKNFLYNNSSFNYINIYKLRNKLFIYLENKPLIYKINFYGNNYLSNKKIFNLLKKFDICKGKYINIYNLLKFKKYLINKYKLYNIYNFNIKFNIININNNKYLLKIFFYEGFFFKIRNLFIKNLNINKYNLLYLFKYKIFNLNNFIYNLKKIKFYYINKGYLNFKIKNIYIKFFNDMLDIYIDFNKGYRYILSDIKINNNFNKYNIYINNIINKYFIKNNFYKKIIIKKIILNIKNIFLSKKFKNLIINKKIKVLNNNFKNKFILFLNIYLKNNFYVNKIIFKGNINFNKKYLLKNFLQKEKYLYNKNFVKLDLLNLKKNKFFNKIILKKEFLNNSNKLNLIYFIKENNKGIVNFGIGYNKIGSLNYNINLYKKNLFFYRDYIYIKIFKNNFINKNIFSYKYKLNNNNIFLNYKIFYNNLLNNNFNNDYLEKNYGFKKNIIFFINNYTKYILGFKYINSNLYNIKSKLNLLKYFDTINKKFYINNKNNNININDFFLINNIIINKFDNNIFPNKGYYIDIYNKVTLPYSDNNFYNLIFNFKKYLYLKKGFIFYINNYINYINSFFNKNLPLNKKLYIKEKFFLRGFNLENIKKNNIFINSKNYKCKKNKKFCFIKDYYEGNLIFLNNFELIIPNYFFNILNSKYIRLSLFLDSGIIFDTNINKNINNKSILRLSLGLCLKIITPLGPMNFSYGLPIKYNNFDEINNLQFSLGNFI